MSCCQGDRNELMCEMTAPRWWVIRNCLEREECDHGTQGTLSLSFPCSQWRVSSPQETYQCRCLSFPLEMTYPENNFPCTNPEYKIAPNWEPLSLSEVEVTGLWSGACDTEGIKLFPCASFMLRKAVFGNLPPYPSSEILTFRKQLHWLLRL